MKWLVTLMAAAMAACGTAGSPTASAPSTRDVTTRQLAPFAARSLVDALARHDLATVEAMFEHPVGFRGLWFSDPACAQQLPQPRVIDATVRAAFVKCLGTLASPRVSDRRHLFPDVAVLDYGPGIEMEMRFVFVGHEVHVAWIGYADHDKPTDLLPSVTPEALAALAHEPDQRLSPDARAKLAALATSDHHPYSAAWLKVCIDATGAVTSAHMIEATSSSAADIFRDALAAHPLRPFEIDGRALPVCARVRFREPDAKAGEDPFPPSSDGVVMLPQDAIQRIEGDPRVAPDLPDRILLKHVGNGTVVSAFKVCIDESGAVYDVTTLEASPLPAYDTKFQRAARTWRYKPVVLDGKPTRACTAVSLVYTP